MTSDGVHDDGMDVVSDFSRPRTTKWCTSFSKLGGGFAFPFISAQFSWGGFFFLAKEPKSLAEKRVQTPINTFCFFSFSIIQTKQNKQSSRRKNANFRKNTYR
jgi:hypothetical protein